MSLSLELIRDELEDGAEAADLVPLIDRALGGSARMTTMIEDVLSFARLGTSIEPVPVDLAKVAAEVVSRPGEPARRMSSSSVGDLPTVPGDEAQLRALLQNLLTNAAKFRAEDRAPVVSVVGDPGRRRAGGSRWPTTASAIPEDAA